MYKDSWGEYYDDEGHRFMTNLCSWQKDAIIATLEKMKGDPNVIGFGVHVHTGPNAGPCGSDVAVYTSNHYEEGDLTLFWKEFENECTRRRVR
jgi:hypothetical protein